MVALLSLALGSGVLTRGSLPRDPIHCSQLALGRQGCRCGGKLHKAAYPIKSPQEGMQRWYELQIRPSPPDLGTQCRPPCTSAQCQPGIWGRQASTVGRRAAINHSCLRLSERTPRWYRVWLQEVHTSQPKGTHTHRESASSFRALALVMSAPSLTASSFTRPARMLGSGGHCRHEYLQWVNEQALVLQAFTASDTYLWGPVVQQQKQP